MFTTIQKQWDILPRWLQIVLGRLLLVVPQMFGVLLVTFSSSDYCPETRQYCYWAIWQLLRR
jgi:hypothetical protein